MYVTFMMGDHEMVATLDEVREVVRAQSFDEVPGMPNHIRGVLHLRGVPVPVSDIRTDRSEPVRDVLVLVGEGLPVLGVAVDRVVKVTGDDDFAGLVGAPEGLPPYVRGVMRRDDATSDDHRYLVDLRAMVDSLAVVGAH